MNTLPQLTDLLELERLYKAARLESGNIKWEGHHPDYPESIEIFFDYITSSAWCNRDYKPSETEKLLREIKTVSIYDIQSILTAASRRERFWTGAWKHIVEYDDLSVVIERAKEIFKT